MSMSPIQSHGFLPAIANFEQIKRRVLKQTSWWGGFAFCLLLSACMAVMTGCGSGGYAGGGVVGLSKSSATIDAGQSIMVNSQVMGSPSVSWNLTGSSCNGNSCGTLSGTTGDSVTYTAPASLGSQIGVKLTAGVAGTQNSDTVSITVNPDPTISGTMPAGTVGTAYSAAVSAAGGTAPLKWSIAGTLPAGLSFNASTGVVSGTPTAAGSATVTFQITDSSDVPYTATLKQTISVSTPGAALTVIGGNPPAGTVGTAYSTTLQASGGSSPYTWSIISGAVPTGLSLGASTGVISGVPTASGTYVFTAQAQDSLGNQASAVFSIVINQAQITPVLTLTNPPGATVGKPYTGTVGVTGGTAPYTCTITGLPAGLTSSGCTISGTPTTAGTSTLTVTATDSSSPSATKTGTVTLTVAPATVTLTLGTLPGATAGTPYNATLPVTGGTAPYTCTITGLPAGLTSSGCTISGTPTTAGTSTLTVTATDSSNPAATKTGTVTLTVAPAAVTLTLGTLPGATVGTPYSATLPVTGGTAPYTCTITGLPAGLTSSGCAISGTPTTAGTSTLTVTATDSSSPSATKTGTVSLTVAPATVTLTLGTLPNGTVGNIYTATLGVSGGKAPYACTITGLPAGLTASGCAISGTPITAGTSTLTVIATDASSPVATKTGTVSLTIAPAAVTLTLGTLPGATVGTPYSATLPVTGGTAPYACTITGLPAGLTSSGCTISGTPTTAGTSTLTVTATDSSSPTATKTGTVSLTVAPAAVTLTLGTLPGATVGTPYSATLPVTGGKAPYTCTITGLPAGLTSSGCAISGTPTTAGTSTLTVTATDSSSPVATKTGTVSLTVAPAAVTLTLGTLPNGTVGNIYTATLGVSGGKAPYACTITGLPAGLTSSGCAISGTPTTAGTSTLTVTATDSSSPVATKTGTVSLTIAPAAVTLTLGTLPNGTVGSTYTATLGVTGGTAPYACTITGLPAGLTSSGCQISGTPTTAGTSTLTVTATDSSSPVATKTGTVSLTIAPAAVTLTLGTLPNATDGTPYTATLGVTGGTAPYACTITGLPAGLTATGCTISGTPTTSGTVSLNVTATDSSSPQASKTGTVSLTILPIPALTLTGTLPNAILNQPYTQTLTATGGVQPYTYSIVPGSGSLPPGLTLGSDGVVSGTPTAPGASSFTVQVTDSEATPQTATLALVLLVVYPTTPNDAEFIGPYAYLFQGYDDHLLGILSYQTATVGSFTADGAGAIGAGEMDANHQTSIPSATGNGNTVSSNKFLGTYTIGTDNRGLMTLSDLNPDGTVATTTTYAISIKNPPAAGQPSSGGDMIEFDNNSLAGTRGSGTMLAQQTGYANGLSGSYVFGLSGDTPCLPTCTLGIIAGPAASVGQFTISGSTIAGTGDSNIATTNYPSKVLSGGLLATDANGRASLTIDTPDTPNGVYPTDYAVYTVSPTQAFLMSTDTHSAFVLLAGSAQQQQTPGSYSNASMNGAFIGYENSSTNPNLVTGLVLENVLNLSTATIFRGTANQSGNCTITNYDEGGLTGLVNGVTGILSGLTGGLLEGLLGPAATTGPLTCNVATNGRGTLQYPVPTLLGIPTGPAPLPRVFYLSSQNNGYFLETAYAGIGNLELQVPPAGGFVKSTFNGDFVYGTASAASLASINVSGFLEANGAAGTATTAVDENIGVGTINVLQLGPPNGTPAILGISLLPTPTAVPFTLTDSTAGRYTLGTDVIYAINPNRFVLVDTNITLTSPSVTLLY